MGFIYKIEGPLNFPDKIKVYVGSTSKTLNERWLGHKSKYKEYNTRDSSLPLYISMKKYNIDNFKISLLEECNDNTLLIKREIYWTIKLNSLYPNGYNINIGNKKNIKSINLPHGINYYTTIDSKDIIYHGYRIRAYVNEETRVIVVPIDEPLTDKMLDDANEYLRLTLINYNNSLIDPLATKIKIPAVPVKRSEASLGLPEYINFSSNANKKNGIEATRHGYVFEHKPSGNKKRFHVSVNETFEHLLDSAIEYKSKIILEYDTKLLEKCLKNLEIQE